MDANLLPFLHIHPCLPLHMHIHNLSFPNSLLRCRHTAHTRCTGDVPGCGAGRVALHQERHGERTEPTQCVILHGSTIAALPALYLQPAVAGHRCALRCQRSWTQRMRRRLPSLWLCHAGSLRSASKCACQSHQRPWIRRATGSDDFCYMNPTSACCWLQTERAKLAAALVTAARRAVLLSGTPALNRPKELFTQANYNHENYCLHI